MEISTGSFLLEKVTNSSSDYFNRRIYNWLDKVMDMEDKYKLKNPFLLKSDPNYGKYGPLACCG